MEATSPPLVDCFTPVHSGLPSYFETLHEGFEKFEIDDVVLDDQHVDRRDCTIKQSSG